MSANSLARAWRRVVQLFFSLSLTSPDYAHDIHDASDD